jgi:uncharacterized membrane protein
MSLIQKSYNQLAGQKISRMEALSDGVFAIALTLLVLDLKVPVNESIHSEKDLVDAFCDLTPKLLSYFLSFMTLGIFWTGHTAQFTYIEKSDRHLNWISLFFLLFVSLLPFTTGFLSEHIHFRFSILLYWFNIFALGICLLVHWNYAARKGFISGEGAERGTIVNVIRRRIVIAQTLYALGALLCLVNNYLSIFVIIAIQLNYALAIFGKSGSRK